MESMTSEFRDLTKSVLGLSAAASLFGASQFARLLDLRAPVAGAADVSRRLDAVTEKTTDQLSGWVSTVFGRTDVLQRSLVDLMFDLVTLNTSGLLASSGPILNPAASALAPLVTGVDRLMPGAGVEMRWLELRNKVEIYFLVENAATRLGISPVESTPLPDLVGRAYDLGPFLALWAIEGLGHAYGQQAIDKDQSPRGLLTGPEAEACPSSAMSMLHAGIGLAFAQKLLDSMTPATPTGALATAIENFIRLSRENSRPGYIGAAYESLGLVTRTFHQDLVARVGQEVAQSHEDLLGYFWHGVGRAIYFAPRNFLPCTEINWASAADAAPDDLGRLNIVAGLAWAVTLVNMRQPAIMEWLLSHHGDVVLRPSAFANGVTSAVLVRYDTTPEAPFLESFVNYQPASAARETARLWEREVSGPAVNALQNWHGPLKRAGRLGEVFRFPAPAGLNQKEVYRS
jgi:hypothetical protein